MTLILRLITTAILIAIWLPAKTQASSGIKQTINIKQSQNQLQFRVQIINSQDRSMHFKLQAQAKILEQASFNTSNNGDGSFDLSLKPQQTGQILYTINLATGPSASQLFLTGEDAWLPTLSGTTANTVQTLYTVSAALLPDYQLIQSNLGREQEDLAFVICKCRRYTSSNQRLNVYLQRDEPDLARTLLEALQGYLTQFEKAYGPYPYDQFSVVESPDEVGYAFPKMTWIGSQLLHFPFILKTSLPHELLHSWWGNGVFVDASKGNWCEGLTTFGADYGLLSEPDKKLYRVKAITNFLNYTQGGTEISLSQFVSRGEDRSLQAVGYDKALMLYIMLETQVGKSLFNQSLREFYRRFKYKKASFEDFFTVLSQTSKFDFTDFKKFWLYSKGLLPKDLLHLTWQESPNQLVFEGNLMALKNIPGLPLNILALMPDQTVSVFNQKVRDDGKGLELKSLPAPIKPISYTFDQDFLLLRELSANEKPVTFSQFFATSNIKVISSEPTLVSQLSSVFPNSKFETLPSLPNLNTPQLLIVDTERALASSELQVELKKKGLEIDAKQIRYNGQSFDLSQTSFFISLKTKQSRLLIVSLAGTQTIARWLQRWSHYGDKGYLILDSKSALLQGVWLEPSPVAL